jgi:hypothetical protein
VAPLSVPGDGASGRTAEGTAATRVVTAAEEPTRQTGT